MPDPLDNRSSARPDGCLAPPLRLSVRKPVRGNTAPTAVS